MQDILYRGDKVLLLTSEDIEKYSSSKELQMEIQRKLAVLRHEGYRGVFVITALPIETIPKRIRVLLKTKENCFCGFLM